MEPSTREFRFTSRPEVRAEGSGRFISGHAAVFNTTADIGGMFLERVKPGAFARAIREKQNVACLLNHDPNLLLGRVSNGTLSLKEDTKGLWFRCDVAKTSAGEDALAMVRTQLLGECSFGMIVTKDEWTTAADPSGGRPRDLRTILDLNLFDVSAVTYPAYSGTNVGADEGARMAFMFPSGTPSSAPLELRSRIAQTVQISNEEFLDRLRARNQAQRLVEGL
jgi:HK97 family phage prohead protease